MGTLHIFRSEPDEQVSELIRTVTPGETDSIALYEHVTDYDELVQAIFSHDHVISWW